MKAWRAYIAGLGTSGVLIASCVLLLAVVSAIVAFRGYPGEASNDGLDRLDVGQTRPTAAVSKAERARAEKRSAGRSERRGGARRDRAGGRGARDSVRGEGAGQVLGERLDGGGVAGGAGGSATGGGGGGGGSGVSGLTGGSGAGGVPLRAPSPGDVTGGIDQVVEDTTGGLGDVGSQVPRDAPVVGGDVGGVVDQTAPVVEDVTGQVDGATDTVDGVTGDLTGGG